MIVTIVRRGVRWYPEADNMPFVFKAPGSRIASVISFATEAGAKQFIYKDPAERIVTYVDARDAAAPFKSILAYPAAHPPEDPYIVPVDPQESCESCQ